VGNSSAVPPRSSRSFIGNEQGDLADWARAADGVRQQ
jgi:hypothetical protein